MVINTGLLRANLDLGLGELINRGLQFLVGEVCIKIHGAGLPVVAVDAKRPLQYLIARTPEGRWTAIFYGDCQNLLGTGFAFIWY